MLDAGDSVSDFSAPTKAATGDYLSSNATTYFWKGESMMLLALHLKLANASECLPLELAPWTVRRS